jgi:holo-ACP synthase
MNVPGPVKVNYEISLAFEQGFQSLLRDLKRHNMRVLHAETCHLITGPEGYIAVDSDAERVKRLCIQLEERSMRGRLYDIDVHSPKGAISREDIGLNPRKCLLCGQNAKLCSRSRRHSVEELMLAVHGILCGSPAGNMERA